MDLLPVESFHSEGKSLWVGWPGVSSDSLDKKSKRQINEDLLDKQFCPVFLNELELDNFYFGFSNKCLWPYFITLLKFTNLIYSVESYKSKSKVC